MSHRKRREARCDPKPWKRCHRNCRGKRPQERIRLQSRRNNELRCGLPLSAGALYELLTNAMLFVLPSDLEGMSLALLDAMGAGLCGLTSDIPENRELVDGAGFTFQGGSATDLADGLRFLIANPAVREAAGSTARSESRKVSVAKENILSADGIRSAAYARQKAVARAMAAGERRSERKAGQLPTLHGLKKGEIIGSCGRRGVELPQTEEMSICNQRTGPTPSLFYYNQFLSCQGPRCGRRP